MKMEEVESSTISHIGYDKDTQKLRVQFRPNGGIYEYDGVGETLFLHFRATDSKGTFFHRHIKKDFVTRKLDADEVGT